MRKYVVIRDYLSSPSLMSFQSGYRVEFLPLYSLSHAPPPPNSPDAREGPNTEPIYITTYAWPPHRRRGNGGEYITTWYVGQIPEEAVGVTHYLFHLTWLTLSQVREESTGMPNEQHYSSHLMSISEALSRLDPPEKWVVEYAWQCWTQTLEIEAQREAQREARATQVQSDGGLTSP